jgi:transcription initiation factor IIE alpha subunit
MLLADEVIEILREKGNMKLEELATKTEIIPDRIKHFRGYLETMIEDNLIKYDKEKEEFSL